MSVKPNDFGPGFLVGFFDAVSSPSSVVFDEALDPAAGFEGEKINPLEVMHRTTATLFCWEQRKRWRL